MPVLGALTRRADEWPAYRTYVRRAGGREVLVLRLVPTGRGAPGGPGGRR